MGMDVYGINPTSEKGEYFRNNIWWWFPLADFLTRTYPDLTKGCTYWYSNDGDGLDGSWSEALAHAITTDIKRGLVSNYAEALAQWASSLPRSTCEVCEGSGVRTDHIGRQLGYDKPRNPITGIGGCNGCSGKGTRAHSLSHSPFSVENVKEFSDFLRECGGFEIK